MSNPLSKVLFKILAVAFVVVLVVALITDPWGILDGIYDSLN